MIESLEKISAGVLMAISSLPGSEPVGTLGKEAEDFLYWLKDHGFAVWQMLPLTPLGEGDCPYASPSAFAIDPIYIDISLLKPLIAPEINEKIQNKFASSSRSGLANYENGRQRSEAFLAAAFASYQNGEVRWSYQADFEKFCRIEKSWLDDWALYTCLSKVYQTGDFSKWPLDVRERHPRAIAAIKADLNSEMKAIFFEQFLAHKSLQNLRKKASALGIQLIGDVPIYVSYESADVWAHQEIFQLDSDVKPMAVSGVPPDGMCADGQVWNHPLYRWEILKEQQFEFWSRRLKRTLHFFDKVRLDHFIGFARYFSVPKASSAKYGQWHEGPGTNLFECLQEQLGRPLPFIAEDLGATGEDVEALRRQIQIPGMAVLVFGLEGEASHKCENVGRDKVYYTSTHDTNTLMGTWLAQSAHQDHSVLAYRTMLTAAFGSKAAIVIVPWQDVMALPEDARMNIPGTPHGNWQYRAKREDISSKAWLKDLVAATGRSLNSKDPDPGSHSS